MRYRAFVFAVVFALVGTAGSAPHVSPATAAEGDVVSLEPVDRAMDEALRVRAELGLSTDLGEINALLRDADADRRMGTPMTPAEIELMKARAAVQRSLQPLRDYLSEAPHSFAGLWLSYPPGGTPAEALTVNVNVASGTPEAVAGIESLIPPNATLQLHIVPFTASQLHDVRMKLRADEDWFRTALGTRLRVTELDVVHNEIAVYVDEASPGTERAIAEHFGPGKVRVEEIEDGGLDACTRANCGPPWVGGVKIARVGPGNECTLGVVVRKGTQSVYGIWTAGHCGNGTWKQGSTSGTTIGTTVSGSNMSFNGSTADVQVIGIPATQKTNRYIADVLGCNPCNTPSLTGSPVQQPFNGDEVGDSVCNNGAFSGRVCGVIQSTNVDNFQYPAGIYLFNQRRASYSRSQGDSGGTVIAAIGLDVAGSHVHYQTVDGLKRGVYSHAWEMSLSGWSVWNGV